MSVKYCDFDAGTDGDGSIGSPWNNLASMKSGITSNDTVNMKGSETTGLFYWDVGKNATWQLWSGNTCTITFSAATYGIIQQSGILTIDDISFTTSGTITYALIDFQVAGSVIKNCTMNNYTAGLTGIRTSVSGSVTIENNTIYSSTTSHGVLIDAPNCIVRHNYIYDIADGHDCIFIKEGGDNVDVYGNKLQADSTKSDLIIRGGASGASNLTGVKVHDNLFLGTNQVSGIDIDASLGNFSLGDIEVYNNVFLNKKQSTKDNSYAVIRLNTPAVLDSGNPIKIYNNSISLIGSDTAGEMFKAGISLDGIVAGDYIDLQNNIVRIEDTDSNNYAYAIRMDGTLTNVTEDYGVYYSTESNILDGTFTFGGDTIITTDPNYTNNTNDLTLQTGSIALNSGVSLSSFFTTGLDENATWPEPDTVTRPIGAAWDKGAYEHIVSPVRGSWRKNRNKFIVLMGRK